MMLFLYMLLLAATARIGWALGGKALEWADRLLG